MLQFREMEHRGRSLIHFHFVFRIYSIVFFFFSLFQAIAVRAAATCCRHVLCELNDSSFLTDRKHMPDHESMVEICCNVFTFIKLDSVIVSRIARYTKAIFRSRRESWRVATSTRNIRDICPANSSGLTRLRRLIGTYVLPVTMGTPANFRPGNWLVSGPFLISGLLHFSFTDFVYVQLLPVNCNGLFCNISNIAAFYRSFFLFARHLLRITQKSCTVLYNGISLHRDRQVYSLRLR